jgi:hypothetical protein
MTAHQFRAALRRLGLSQVGAARLLRVDGRTAQRWALGERSIPASAAIIVNLMIAGKITAADVERA